MISRRKLMAGAAAVAAAAALPVQIVPSLQGLTFRGVPVFLDEFIDGFIVVPGWVPDLIEEVLQEARQVA